MGTHPGLKWETWGTQICGGMEVLGWILQGQSGDATWGVGMAGFERPGSGSAVFLVHAGESRAGVRGMVGSLPAGVSQLRNGCYHTGIVNVL